MSENPVLQTLLDRRRSFLAFVERRVGDAALAEDILQTAYIRALDEAHAPREEASAVAWFYTVLRNAVVDFYRRRATETKGLAAWQAENPSEPTVPDPSTRIFVCGCIAHVLPTMRPAYAEILQAVDLDEQPLATYAAEHDLTPGNAAVRIHRARTALRRELAKFCGACSLHACLNCTCIQPKAA